MGAVFRWGRREAEVLLLPASRRGAVGAEYEVVGPEENVVLFALAVEPAPLRIVGECECTDRIFGHFRALHDLQVSDGLACRVIAFNALHRRRFVNEYDVSHDARIEHSVVLEVCVPGVGLDPTSAALVASDRGKGGQFGLAFGCSLGGLCGCGHVTIPSSTKSLKR